MELTFEKIGDWYISEFEVTSDFNLHIEKEPKGDFYLYQRTSSSGQYDIIEDFGYKKGGDNVIDLDFQALVYPKWIKIKSAVKPLVATITTDGEVNEVVYQAKDIEITSNGTTKVTADTGYTALGSVNVKVNVPTEGGGSGENTIEYIDVRNIDGGYKHLIIKFSSLIKIINDITYICTPLLGSDFSEDFYEYTTAIAIGSSFKLTDLDGFKTIKELLPSNVYDDLPRITKEEFYSLEIPAV